MAELVSATAFVSIYLINAFTTVMSLAQDASTAAGLTGRVARLLEVCDDIDALRAAEAEARPPAVRLPRAASGTGAPRPAIEIRNLAVAVPRLPNPRQKSARGTAVARLDGPAAVVVVSDFSLCVAPGERVLLTGPSGCGKTSVLRCLAGLWEPASGSVSVSTDPPGSVCFVPQKAFGMAGSLAEVLAYPRAPGDDGCPPNHAFVSALAVVGLDHLPRRDGGWEAVRSWGAVLSPGELQRLAIARVLAANPSLVVLDEATSNVDAASEAAIYRALIARGTTVVSVGHSASIVPFHDRCVEMGPGAAGARGDVDAR